MRGHCTENIIGQRYGKLTVTSRAPNKGNSVMWNCVCDCGNSCVVNGSNMRRGLQKSCGCQRRKSMKERTLKHGKSGTRLYRIWNNMKARCNNPNNDDYRNYGRRGIEVCEEWKNSFETFHAWATGNGYSDGLTIERKDVNGNYCPDNCRWATRVEQNRNRRDNVTLTFEGETHTLSEWSSIKGIKPQTVWKRLRTGKTPEEILKQNKLKTRKDEKVC